MKKEIIICILSILCLSCKNNFENVNCNKEIVLKEPETNFLSNYLVNIGIKNKNANLSRLENVLNNAVKGKNVSIGFIGGSITEGAKASDRNKKSYSAIVKRWWEKTFPNIKVNCYNIGIGATNSYFGVHRADFDLLYRNPDIVFIEYSVNDDDTDFFKETYESLVRKILNKENSPAIILINMTKQDFSYAENSHISIAEHYNLPTLSYHDVIKYMIEYNGEIWEDYESDFLHPNNKGHALLGELIWQYLNLCLSNLKEQLMQEYVVPIPLTNNNYEFASIVTPMDKSIDCVNLMGTWEIAKETSINHYSTLWKNENGNGDFIYEGEFKNLGICYYQYSKTYKSASSCGIYDIYVDDEFVKSIDTKGAYTDSITIEIYKSSELALHKVVVRLNPYSTGKMIMLQALLIS